MNTRITGDIDLDNLDAETPGVRLASLCTAHGLSTQAEILRRVCVNSPDDSVGAVVPTSTPEPTQQRALTETQMMPTISA